ncbi:MAG: SpaA isopeptide-forming pilin-related protein [Oscillospiraceae bacterium]|nr:SpaA isopeptide-forming pilin-related protein [Oscillospiraceae bacterium]
MNAICCCITFPECRPRTNARRCCANLCFQVIDSSGCPINGAVYQLRCQCGDFRNAVSCGRGCVCFRGILPGTYQLTQLAPAAGFEMDAAPHEVEVDRCCRVRIDGLPLRCFVSINEREGSVAPEQSEQPYVNPVYAGAVTVSGLGVPGSVIEVSFPNGCKSCATVLRDGSWSLNVPEAFVLEPDDELIITQTTECMAPSEPLSVTVEEVVAP